MSIHKLITVEEFEDFVNLPENADLRFEYIDGEIIEVPSNAYSSEVAALIIAALVVFARAGKLGHVTGEGGGYIVVGARLAPDVAFVSKTRQAALDRQGCNAVAPDLAVEVMSPTDKDEYLEKKLAKYAEAGVLIWVFRPARRVAQVHKPGQPMQEIDINGTLDGGDVLPEFKLPLRDIFPEV